MKTTHTFNVHFWLKKKSIRRDKTIPIYARIRLDSTPVDVSTKQSTLEEHWCGKAGRLNPKVKDAKFINDEIDIVYSKIRRAYRELRDEGIFITAQAIKLRYSGEDTPMRTLSDLLKYHQQYEIKKLEQGTAKNYGSTQKYLLSFILEKYRTNDIRLSQIDYAFVLSFENYLRTCKPLMASQPLTNNGIMKHMERLKKMTTIACKLDAIKKDPFAFFNANFIPFDREFLNMEELLAIENQFFKDPGVGRVRDIFVFACYTGLAYIDTRNLKPEQVVFGIDGDEWIFTRREKSKTPVKIPLLDKAKRVLDKYSGSLYGKDEDLLLPVYSNQKCNEYLKIIASQCNIKKNITFHVARHTFATTITMAHGVPIETVSKLLGHKRLSTTQIYARVMEQKISDDMALLKDKLSSKQKELMKAV
ncbi:site-specific integrase [uncultured Croceitalea sp.]|uniref:site-specific integrase n=1 Tax=uncultured Croceitalea sp. TaxID=1798908 RepID=UPI00374F252D